MSTTRSQGTERGGARGRQLRYRCRVAASPHLPTREVGKVRL